MGQPIAAFCDLDTNDIPANQGQCVLSFPRHNANPFLTNIAGNAGLVSGAINTLGQNWVPATDANGDPVEAVGWSDPCNPPIVPQRACKQIPACTATLLTGCTSGRRHENIFDNNDCPGHMACPSTGPNTGKCVAAKTAYYCATHLDGDCEGSSNSLGAPQWLPPVDPVNWEHAPARQRQALPRATAVFGSPARSRSRPT